MKKEEVPQDKGNLSNKNMKELVYATDEKGNYSTSLSTGWEPKTIALSNAIEDINERIALAKNQVKTGEMSPIFYAASSVMILAIIANGIIKARKANKKIEI